MIPQLFGPAFGSDPDSVFDELRRSGPIALAELDAGVFAMVVTGHDAATDLLSDATGAWTRDTRAWADLARGHVPPDSAVLGILAWRDGLLHSDGHEHDRLAAPLMDAMDQVPHHRLEAITRGVANRCLDSLVSSGRADLVGDFAMRIPLLVFAELLACSPDASQRMVDACALIVSGGQAAADGANMFITELAAVVEVKRTVPGEDLASWMLAHPHQLTPVEVTGNLFSLVGAGNVPTASWIVNAAQLLLTDNTYAGDITSGALSIRRAMQKALWERAPVGTFTFLVARRPAHIHGVDIPAGMLVLVSHHAANTSPHLQGLGYDSNAHLAWGGGEHRCPVPGHAATITHAAISVLLDRASDARVTDVGPNSDGFFHQAPTHLHITFTPTTS